MCAAEPSRAASLLVVVGSLDYRRGWQLGRNLGFFVVVVVARTQQANCKIMNLEIKFLAHQAAAAAASSVLVIWPNLFLSLFLFAFFFFFFFFC